MFGDDNEGVDVLCLMWESPAKRVQGGRAVGVPSFTHDRREDGEQLLQWLNKQ